MRVRSERVAATSGVAIFLFLLFGPAAWAITETQRLTANDAEANDIFGVAVGISGGAAVIGAAGDDDLAMNAGAAYIFRNPGSGTWSQQAKLKPMDGAAGDKFGSSAAISGTTAIVGALRDSGLGSAYIFRDNGIGTWLQVDKLLGNDTLATDQFGISVAISGNTAVVGARKHNSAVGAAYVFRDNGANDWQQIGKLTPSDAAALSEFGTSVAISGNTALIGAPFNSNAGGAANGAVYVFQDNGSGTWSQVDKLMPADGAVSKQFGTSVSFSANTAVIGAIGDDTKGGLAGAAYIFQRDGLLAWHQIDKLTASDGATFDRLGTAVALSGNMAIVGQNAAATAPGAAYLFRDNGFGNWNQVAKFTASDPQSDSSFGKALSISGATAIVGAALANNPGLTDAGAAYLYAIAAGLAGDYSKNGVVDAADYVVWRKQLNQVGMNLAADGNGDGVVNQADYQLWRENIGIASATGTAATTTIPEPMTGALLCVSVGILFSIRMRCVVF